MTDAPEILNTQQAAEFLGVSKQFLEIARCRGEGPAYSRIGRLIRYRKEVLLAWVAAHEVQTAHHDNGIRTPRT